MSAAIALRCRAAALLTLLALQAGGARAAPAAGISPALLGEKTEALASEYCSRLAGEESVAGERWPAAVEEFVGDAADSRIVKRALAVGVSAARLPSNEGFAGREKYVQGQLLREVSVKALVFRSLPIVLAVLMLLVAWPMFCTTCLPCRSCQCRSQRERRTTRCAKVGALSTATALCIGALAVGLSAHSSVGRISSGVDGSLCAAARFANATVVGQGGSTGFVGITAILDGLRRFNDNLRNDSVLMRGADSVVQNMAEVDRSAVLLNRTVALLKHAITLPVNQDRCELCNKLKDPVEALEKVLQEDDSKPFARSISEIQKRVDSKGDLQWRTEAAIEVTQNFTNFFDQVATAAAGRDDLVSHILSHFDGQTSTAALAGLVLACIVGAVALCGCMSAALLVWREKSYTQNCSKNPYRKTVHRCAGLTWCCGFGLAGMALLLGGIALIAAVPLNGTCHMLTLPSHEEFNSVSSLFGTNLANLTESATKPKHVLGAAFGQCISADGNINGTASLFSLFDVGEGHERMPLQEKVDNYRAMITLGLSIVAGKISGVREQRLNSKELQTVLDLLAETPDVSDGEDYRCDLFKGTTRWWTGGPRSGCDPQFMKQFQDGTWHHDCYPADEFQQRQCQPQAFSRYLSAFTDRLQGQRDRLEQALHRLETVTLPHAEGLLQTEVFGDVDRLSAQNVCGFVGKYYKEMAFGLCHGAVGGLHGFARSVVGVGVVAFGVALLAYAIWLHARDNVRQWTPVVEPNKVAPGPVLLGSRPPADEIMPKLHGDRGSPPILKV